MQLKPPGKIIDGKLHATNLFMAPVGKGHTVMEHGKQQCLCGMGADDLAFEPGIYEIRYPAGVADAMIKPQISIAAHISYGHQSNTK